MSAAPALECLIGYDPDAGCVTMAWRGYAAGQAFRDANEAVLAAIAARRASRLLGDIEALERIGPEDQDWLAYDWIPRAVGAGLRAVALVTPAFQLGHGSVRLVGEQTPAGLALEYFDEPEAAREWLRAH